MDSDEPKSLEPERRLIPAGAPLLVGLLAFLAGVLVTVLLVHLSGSAAWQVPDKPASPVPAPRPAAVPPLPAGTDMATLNAREVALAARLDQIENQLGGIEGSARSASSYATRAESLMVAFAARRLLDRGQPLGPIENQLRLRFGATNPEAVATIIRVANEPVTIEDLRLALDMNAPTLKAAGSGTSWWGRIRGVFNDLIVLRQESSPSPRPADRLDRARRRLDAGQVEPALAEVARLPGVENAKSWVTAANHYIAARHALAEIETSAMQSPLPATAATAPADAVATAAPTDR